MTNSPKEIISSVEKDLSMIELDIKQKLKMINEPPVPSVGDLSRRRASIRE